MSDQKNSKNVSTTASSRRREVYEKQKKWICRCSPLSLTSKTHVKNFSFSSLKFFSYNQNNDATWILNGIVTCEWSSFIYVKCCEKGKRESRDEVNLLFIHSRRRRLPRTQDWRNDCCYDLHIFKRRREICSSFDYFFVIIFFTACFSFFLLLVNVGW